MKSARQPGITGNLGKHSHSYPVLKKFLKDIRFVITYKLGNISIPATKVNLAGRKADLMRIDIPSYGYCFFNGHEAYAASMTG